MDATTAARKIKLDEFYELIKSHNENDKFVMMKWEAGNNSFLFSNDNISVTNEKIGAGLKKNTIIQTGDLTNNNIMKNLLKKMQKIQRNPEKLLEAESMYKPGMTEEEKEEFLNKKKEELSAFTKDSEKGLLHWNHKGDKLEFVKTINIDISKLYFPNAPCTVCTSKVYIFQIVERTERLGDDWYNNFYKRNKYFLAFFKEPDHYNKEDISPLWFTGRMQSLINKKLGYTHEEWRFD